jgi:predicted DNA-binding transcriptional regulator AlpA
MLADQEVTRRPVQIDVHEVANLLGVSLDTVRKMHALKQLPGAVRLSNSRLRFDLDAILALVKERATSTRKRSTASKQPPTAATA